ncbi:hypothetical protein EYZ11_012930 [Aspergillus tanneri]|uniref:Uncharacterized protein n=1 Tax=Aspergillus tanneri TaxID=1220188 RepID=A0A4V3UMJ9_9EURO|nr:hypothetical protein EYZ11_012930 [Aspergillus tanneri]
MLLTLEWGLFYVGPGKKGGEKIRFLIYNKMFAQIKALSKSIAKNTLRKPTNLRKRKRNEPTNKDVEPFYIPNKLRRKDGTFLTPN